MPQRHYLLLISCILLLHSLTLCQDLVFPTDEDKSFISNKQPITDRVPLSVPGQCPRNMILYPVSGPKNISVCDCKSGFLYVPANDSCYEAYKRGPCPQGNYLILSQGETVPKCEVNPCRIDGMVPYNDTCSPLHDINGPCEEDHVLAVNETTFLLECTHLNIVPLMIIQSPRRGCPAGSRRNTLGLCREVL